MIIWHLIQRSARYLYVLPFLTPRMRLLWLLIMGVIGGLGLAIVQVSRATSYLGDAPETCVNCHVMTPQYVLWQHSSHREVATCNDCHVPHDNVFHHYAFKAQDGTIHSTVFTLHREPQVIRLSQRAIPVVEANCRRCHASVVGAVHVAAYDPAGPRCWDCHRETPHSFGRSLAATPRVMGPQLPSVLNSLDDLTIGGRPVRPAAPAPTAPAPGAQP